MAALSVSAQPIEVFSEFQRMDPAGEILPQDRAESPREILSPALVRGAKATFLVRVTPPADGAPYHLYLAQNPERFAGVQVYRPVFAKVGAAWVPDALQPMAVTAAGALAPVPPQVPEQKSIILVLDVSIPRTAAVRRTRLELQYHSGGNWVIYPLELRIRPATLPAAAATPLEPLAGTAASAAASAAAVLRGWMCGPPAKPAMEGPLTLRSLIRRNARQDAALARALEPAVTKAALAADLAQAAGADTVETLCSAQFKPPADLGAEWYLKVRDLLLRTAEAKGGPEVLSAK